MKYYRVEYRMGKRNEHALPDAVREVVWKVTQNHFADQVMIGGTDSKVTADGKGVVELAEKEALQLIEKFKKSFPSVTADDLVPSAEVKEKGGKKKPK